MVRMLLGTTAAFILAMAVPFAQQQPAPQATPAHNTFVLAGCLEAPLNQSSGFKLTSASPLGQAPAARATQSGAVGTAGEKGTYELQPTSGFNQPGIDAAQLKAHVGQRVEVTVRPIETTAEAGPLPTENSSARAAGAPVVPTPERFSVTAIKRVSNTCQ